MPSEAQSQEPRDRGPAPPVTRAGRSAQLAKAAATSPAPERRPRGRPRKDGSSGRSAPPTPPPPPPPPPPKSRKKGRSRGRAQVEDEESMDATEKKTPQKKGEKTTGRRRSTTRRKSNTNPDPNLLRLSPEPETDPEPPVPKSSQELAPSAEAPALPPAPSPTPASSPGEEPRATPLPTSPSQSQNHSPTPNPASSPRPAPSPDEEDRPSPSRSPAPMEVDCSPSPVPMETEGGGASPMERSPALSPCSSPLVSPCLQLEEEDSLSPLFQRCLSEDSGGSPTPSLGHTEKRLKQCAFCYLGNEPPLGQGRLVVFGPTPGYIPLHILNNRASPDRDNDCHDHCYRGNQAQPTSCSPEQSEGDESSEFLEQLGPIGLPHDINVQSLFDPTGQCCAHLQCAAWSEGVCRGEGQSLLYVDKAIESGSTQVCAFCCRLGASLRCQETGCGRSYHFPCAAVAGAHQDWSQRHTLCSRHTHTVSSQCVLCSDGGDVGDLLMCSCCGNCYHGSCLDPPLTPSLLCRAGWQCPQCRVCQSCRLRGDDVVLLVCERCDKAYHTHCLTPPLDHTLSTGWSCRNCRICRRCGVRSSGQWANHPLLCESCDPALPCPLCDHAPDLYTPQDYLTCICCYRCIHTACIVQAGEGRAGSEDYICSTCRPQEEELIAHTPTPQSPALAVQSPTQAPTKSISQPPSPSHTEAPPITCTAHSPVRLTCSGSPQSPTKTFCEQMQQSPAPSHPESPAPPLSPEPCHPDPKEVHQSTAPTQADQTAPSPTPAGSFPVKKELPESSEPSHRNPTERQESPAQSYFDNKELKKSPASSQPDHTELQHSPPPSQPDPTDLTEGYVPSPTESSLASSNKVLPNLPKIPQSSNKVLPNLNQILQSSNKVLPSLTWILQSSNKVLANLTWILQSSNKVLANLTWILQSTRKSSNKVLPSITQILQSSNKVLPSLTQILQRSNKVLPSLTQILQSSNKVLPSLTQILQSSNKVLPSLTQILQRSNKVLPSQTQILQSSNKVLPNVTQIMQRSNKVLRNLIQILWHSNKVLRNLTQILQSSNKVLSSLTWILQSSNKVLPSLTWILQSSKKVLPSLIWIIQSSREVLPNLTWILQSCKKLLANLAWILQSSNQFLPNPTQILQSSNQVLPNLTRILQSFRKVPGHLYLIQQNQNLNLPQQSFRKILGHLIMTQQIYQTVLGHLILTPQGFRKPLGSLSLILNPSHNSTQDQLTATESELSPTLDSHTHSPHSPPRHSLNQAGLSPVHVEPVPAEPQKISPPHSPVQDNAPQTQLDRPCSPTNIITTEHQHSPPRTLNSSTTDSPAQDGTSHTHSPKQDTKPTLNQKSPGLSDPAQLSPGATQDISTLDQDLFPVYCRLTKKARRRASLSPVSAPCSPSQSPIRAAMCSLSQPASPAQAHSSQPDRPSHLSLLPSQLATETRVVKECIQTSTIELKYLEHSTLQLSPNPEGKTLENSPAHLSPTSILSTVSPEIQSTDGNLQTILNPTRCTIHSPDHPIPLCVPVTPTPESLVHISTSTEHSSLTCLPSADEMEGIPPQASHMHQSPSRDSPRCTEANEGSPVHIQQSSAGASPTHASKMPTSPASSFQAYSSLMLVETSPVPVSSVAAETSPSLKSASPSTTLVGPTHPSQESEEAVDNGSPFIQSETCSSHPQSTPDIPVQFSPTHVSPVYTEADSSHNLIGSVDVQGSSATHPGQSSPLLVQSTCSPPQMSPVQKSPCPSPTVFSPPHCRLPDTSPTSSSVSHNLSHSGQTQSCSASLTDVGVIHSPPRSSPAGQASPVHIESTCSGADSGLVQRPSPSFVSTTYSSPAHGPFACVSPPRSPFQASETYRSPGGSPHNSPAPDTGTSSGLPVAQRSPSLASSALDENIVASSQIKSTVIPGVDPLDSGLVEPSDSIRQQSPTSAFSLVDDSSSVSPNQAYLSQVVLSPASPPQTPDRSAVENQTSTASGIPFSQGPGTPINTSSTQASPSYASPAHCGLAQDNTAMLSSGPTITTSVSPPNLDHSKASPPKTCPPAPQNGSLHSSPVGRLQSGDIQADPAWLEASPGPCPASPVQPEASSSPGPVSQLRCEASPGPVIPVQSEISPSPGPIGPVLSGPLPSIPQRHTPTERESAATGDVSMLDEQEESIQPWRTEEEEEEDRVAPQQEEETENEEMDEPHQATKRSPEEEECPERTEEDGGEEEVCVPAEVEQEHHQSPPHAHAASPFLPQPASPTTPHSALPLKHPSLPPSPSPPASPLTSPPSPPPSPYRAGSQEASPFSPHRNALLSSYSPHAPPLPPSPLKDPPQEEDPREAETMKGFEGMLEDETLSCHVTVDGSQSENQFEPVALAVEPTKDKHQSHAEPLERQREETEEETEESLKATDLAATAANEKVEEQQPIREQYSSVEEEHGEEARKGAEDQDQSDMYEESVSPVLELDPSFDMEVMELMTSSSPPPSFLHLSSPSPPPFSRRGKGRTLRPPPCSSRPSDDLSIRLRQSPFSTEASPETSPARTPITPPPLSPPSPPHRASPHSRESPPLSKLQAPPTTVLPLTPKIGMGKPAISKRKFSPGRARIKQGSWWSNRRAVSPPSSSQDSTGEGGWDSPKPLPPDSPLWSMRVGRGSGFPGRRRSRGGGLGGGRGGRGRSRLKTQESLPVSPGSVYVEPFQPKEEEENSMHNTVVMFSTSDHFTLRQDMCVVCGSFGQGAEGRLLACSQCGQCYHPYCVNVKITRVILTKGWRCLECTVCEACGEASDPGRLLLCDDCDISYHTYCLDPPLHTVPKGAWKCKWCVWCVQCGSTSPGLHCDWQSNYSRCGPCSSLSRCPLCQRQYTQDDLIVLCRQCDRWVHALCQGLTTEEEVESAADEGFDCSLCRTHGRGSYGRSDSFESPYMAQIISRIREPDTKTYTQDGVCLTESGLSHLQSLVEPLTSPRRYRRCKPKLKLRIINQNSVSVLQTPLIPTPPTEQEHSRGQRSNAHTLDRPQCPYKNSKSSQKTHKEHLLLNLSLSLHLSVFSPGDLECELKSDSSPERDHAPDDDVTKEPEVTDGNKKRKRKPYRPGIGGFMVRQRGGKFGPGRIKLCRRDSTEMLPGQDEDVSMETAPPADQKKRYRKKKTKLEETFPSYLQEAFFGRDLLDQSRQVEKRPVSEVPGVNQSGAAPGAMRGPNSGVLGPSPSGLLPGAMATNAFKKQGTLSMSEEALMDLSDVLNTDPHILATGHTGQFHVERSPSPFAGLDIGSMADSLTGSGGRGQRMVQEEPLDAILSPELDKMVSDGAILSRLYKIPELEGKDVEEVFTAVLSPNSSHSQSEQSQHTHTGRKTNTHNPAASFPRLPLMNGLMGTAPHVTNTPMMHSSAQGPAGFRLPPPESHAPAQLSGPAPRLAMTNQPSAGEGEQDVMSTAQRGTLKWEKEESLGEMATVAPVLYCNTNFPHLKEQYPDWSSRVKQITKMWRKASSQDRAPFVQKARDNRAAQRINKVQLSNDPLKRNQPLQQQQQQQQQQQPPPPPPSLPLPLSLPLPGPYDPVTMEMDGTFKDPLRPRESEQEQEWKLRQGEVNDRWGAGKKRQQSLPPSKALKSPSDKDCPYQAPVAGGGTEALQMRQKSKQQAKMEATQKLEQVKNEQLLQQRQQQLSAGHLSPDAGSRSPMTPGQQPVAGGNASPLHLHASREGQSRQHLLQSSGLADDVFLRPQAPPPSGFSSLPHSPHSSSPLHQPPSSPQMFSPPSSRPSSPWDPYTKVVGTPRPTSSQAGVPPAPQLQRHNSLSSPAHDAFGSPVPSPDSKTPDISRTHVPLPVLQQSRAGMLTPPSGSNSDLSARLVSLRAETYQRSPHSGSNLRAAVPDFYSRAGELVQGGLFKAPMPPQHQSEGFGSLGGRRDPSRPTDLGFALTHSQDPAFPPSPLSGLGSPHRSPYTQTPGTPRPDYAQQTPDPFTQQSPLSSRPSPDPYANPQTPGTPRPHSDPAYLTTPPSLRLDQYNQQSSNRRPSPSHPNLDPYSSNPGTPRPPANERFPRSPGNQRNTDPYAQPPGTPRPSPDPYAQQPSTPRPQKAPEPFNQAPAESFTPQPSGSGSSPLAPGLTGETMTFNTLHHQLQQSPGRQHQHQQQHHQQQQDSFPRTPGGQTQKPSVMSEDFSGLAGQTPGHNPFEQGHMTPGPALADKTSANEMPGLAADGLMSMLPQLGDSEEKLRQRQRLRQLILRQQQQKSALRQEKGLQEASGASAPPAAPPGSTLAAITQHHWSQEDSSAPPADLFGRPPPPYPGTVRPAGAVGALAPRFPGGFPGEQQRSFTPTEPPFPRQSLPRQLGVRGPALRFSIPPGAQAGLQDSFLHPPQGAVPGSGLGVVEGVPVQMRRPMSGEFTGIRPLTVPSTPLQIMQGVPQPFLPRSLPLHQHSIMGQPYIELRHRAPENRLRLPFSDPEGTLLPPRDTHTSAVRPAQGVRMGEGPLGQQSGMEQHLSHTATLTQSGETAGAEGIEEHLEGEDSAVKDLEDVEVKDLVDLNLNLDPEDGKEDLDLGPNDLHLDDFLLSGKFDLIAYADPELNLEDKKDMFNEELDLGEPVEEREGARKTDSHAHLMSQVKQEVKDGIKTESRDGPPATPHPLSLQPSQPPHPGDSSQAQNQAIFLQNQSQDQDQQRHLLLEEQPLLLQDLLDQERQEQQQQKQMQALIRQRPTPDSVLPTMDFDSISDPIMKAKMVALKGINKVMSQSSLGLNPIAINRFQQAPGAPSAPVTPGPEGTPQTPQLVGQDGKLNPPMMRPNPPSFSPGFVNESQRRQYEEWLGETQQLLQMQQRLLEDQIAAHRKTKKALSAKQRTAKKAGRVLGEEDAAQLRNITEQQGAVQKQLEQIRKQQKDHTELIEDYRTKQQHRALTQPAGTPIMSAGGPPVPQTLLPEPMVSIQPHPGGPMPTRLPNVPPGWTPGGGASGVMGQRMPPHLPRQMPPTLPITPQAPQHTPTHPMVPGLLAPTAGFTAGPQGPTGAADDGAATSRQFDDNNPFSEGFQERERRERLREQQERQRVQLMQEVERHRVLQHRLELEQQGLLGASVGPGVAAPPQPGAVSQTPGAAGPAGAVGGGQSSQMPFFSSELPQDFLQSPPASRPPPQHHPAQSFIGGALNPGANPAPGLLPADGGSSTLQTRPRLSGPAGHPALGQVQQAGVGAAGMTPNHPGAQAHRFGHDSSSSSPSTPLHPTFPCSSNGGPSSLMQLFSDIIPDDKPKKKRNRKREGDDTAGGVGSRTPLSSHSDDITAPPTPAVSDTSCSTPSMDPSDLCVSLSSSLSGLAPSSELERQLSVISAAQQRCSVLGMESQRGPLSAVRLEVKEEHEERGACGGGVVKMEEGGGDGFSSPSGDGGKELLRHLLKDKGSPTTTPSPSGQAPPTARRQLSSESVRSEEEERPGSHGNMVMTDGAGVDLPDSFGRKKVQRCKRQARPEKDRAPPKNKRRKKEEEEKMLHSTTSSSDSLTHLTQLTVLPLMEPVLAVDLSLFPPYGSSSLGSDSRLTGSFGNACLEGVTDYYSQLIYKNNLSNPPTPPASLPPTPPPVARQKLVNGFASTEELSRKDITEQEVKGVKQKGEGLLGLNHASKTVDVPASLPTPPHNNQEELRVQDSSERDSPDGFVPSSSPESVADMEISRYPDLSFIKLEPSSPCPSPTLPIIPCAWGKVKQEVKVEPNHQGPSSCSNTDLVTIAITLNPFAAQGVAGVMATVAELLRVPVPVDYQLSGPPGPERSSLALLAGVRVPVMQGAAGVRQQRPPPVTGVRMNYIQHGGSAAAASRPQCCSHCKVLLGNGVRIVKELKQEGQSGPGSSVVFCSPNCSALYKPDVQSRTPGNKVAATVMLPGSERPLPSRAQHQYTSNMSSITVHSLLQIPPSPPPTSSSSSPPLSFPPASAITMETRPRMDSLKVKVKLKPRPRAVTGGEDSLSSRHLKRMKSCRWRRWSFSITLSRGPCIPNEAVSMPPEEEVDMLLTKLGACLRPDPLPKDQRRCCFCSQQGDGQTDGPARLLNLDLDLWVHLNCALWSSEVYETQAGALINVELALRRGLTLRCAHCQRTGATSGCNRLRCTNTYHFTCALQAHCTFFKDKTMLCHLHKPRMVPLGGDRSSSCSPSSTPGQTPDPVVMAASDPYDSELRCFAVFRRVFVQRDEARQIAAVVQRGERQHTFRVGSLLFRVIGRLLPQQMSTFHNKTAIFPVGYHANRFYWSMRQSNRRCKYMCYIEEQDCEPLFKVKVVEKGYDDLILTGPSPKAVWDQVLELVSQLRSSSGTLKLFPVYLKGEDLFGLTTSAVTRIIESLPGVETCERYTFRYGRNPLMEWPLAFNPTGSARSEPKAGQTKRPNLLTSIAPRCQGSVGSIVGLVPGVISLSPGETVAGSHQGRHSKSSQYRRMKAEWKTNVYLARSRIQGLGLYAARDIEKCTMVIEYIGTIIRSEVANRKERLYESQNRGVYMFRIDNDFVIDATITGGPARYINHSCAPNCITEVVTVEKENKIIISSCRRIQRGEELSYDYKFDLEDDQHKIPCHCGAVNCSKWMN
ncbi:LOW QUALITY PROTEIN: histone-lysine N-methyltransferase 2C-like [Tautogolabrus adspersus]